MTRTSLLLLLVVGGCAGFGVSKGLVEPLHRSVDLELGEIVDLQLSDGSRAKLRLLELQETLDDLNGAVRRADVKVEVNGKPLSLSSGNYQLPIAFNSVQIDCPVTKGYLAKSNKKNVWGLVKDVRLRVWPAGSSWIEPGTFQYPAKQRWFATNTQMANEPVFVDGGDLPGKKEIYYHYGLDIGGSEGLVDVVAATDGTVVTSGKDVQEGLGKDTPVAPRYDVIYLRDAGEAYYRYSHLKFIDPAIRVGVAVKKGQKLGVLGKEGGSGGWSHLHFDITRRQPSGQWGIEEGYAFLWQAYREEHPQDVTAVARPHVLTSTGKRVVLNASASRGKALKPEWVLTDGGRASGWTTEKTYEKPGTYSEILKVTDAAGKIDYDFLVVQVCDPAQPENPPPTLSANYAPTFGIRPGDPVLFRVRSFRAKKPSETWDFGDGSAPVTVNSDGNAVMLAPNGYAETIHRYDRPGHYLVRVEHVTDEGVRATARLQVRVGKE